MVVVGLYWALPGFTHPLEEEERGLYLAILCDVWGFDTHVTDRQPFFIILNTQKCKHPNTITTKLQQMASPSTRTLGLPDHVKTFFKLSVGARNVRLKRLCRYKALKMSYI